MQIDKEPDGHLEAIIHPNPELLALRDKINAVDSKLLPLIGQRLALVREVGEIKKRDGFPIRDAVRERQILDNLMRQGVELGIDGRDVEQIWSDLFQIAYRLEE